MRKAQINAQDKAQTAVKTQVKALLSNEAPTIVPIKSFNYNNIFLAKNIAKLSKYTKMNNHTRKK